MTEDASIVGGTGSRTSGSDKRFDDFATVHHDHKVVRNEIAPMDSESATDGEAGDDVSEDGGETVAHVSLYGEGG